MQNFKVLSNCRVLKKGLEFLEGLGEVVVRSNKYIDLGQPKSLAPGPGCSLPD